MENVNYHQLQADQLAMILKRTKSYKDVNMNSINGNLSSSDFVKMQKLIAEKMAQQPDNGVLDDFCIKNLKIFSKSAEMNLKHMTKSLCNSLISTNVRYDFIVALTNEWLKYAMATPAECRYKCFMENFGKFQAMLEYITKVGDFNLQTRILKVLLCYMDVENITFKDHMIDLLSGFLDKSEWIFKHFKSYDKLRDHRKQYMLDRSLLNVLNTHGKQVTSKILRVLYFDGIRIEHYPQNETWVDWNLATKTINFSIHIDNKNHAKAEIDISNLESCYFKIDAYSKKIREVIFKLNNPLALHCDSDATLSSHREVHQVKFDLLSEFEKDEFVALIEEMFPGKLEQQLKKHVSRKESSRNEQEIYQDSSKNQIYISSPHGSYLGNKSNDNKRGSNVEAKDKTSIEQVNLVSPDSDNFMPIEDCKPIIKPTVLKRKYDEWSEKQVDSIKNAAKRKKSLAIINLISGNEDLNLSRSVPVPKILRRSARQSQEKDRDEMVIEDLSIASDASNSQRSSITTRQMTSNKEKLAVDTFKKPMMGKSMPNKKRKSPVKKNIAKTKRTYTRKKVLKQIEEMGKEFAKTRSQTLDTQTITTKSNLKSSIELRSAKRPQLVQTKFEYSEETTHLPTSASRFDDMFDKIVAGPSSFMGNIEKNVAKVQHLNHKFSIQYKQQQKLPSMVSIDISDSD